MMRLIRRRKSERGSELVEFALVSPLLLLVLLGIVDFGFLCQRYQVLTSAAREGARIAVLPGYTATDIQDRVTSYATAAGLPSAPTITVTPASITDGTTTWGGTSVTVTFDHDYLYLDAVGGWFGGSFGIVTLTATATMRNELII